MFELDEEEPDDRLGETVSHHVDAMSDRRALLGYIAVLSTINVLIWLAVLLFPSDVRDAFNAVWETDDKLSKVVLAIMFGLGELVTRRNVGIWQRINSGFSIPWFAVLGFWLLRRPLAEGKS